MLNFVLMESRGVYLREMDDADTALSNLACNTLSFLARFFGGRRIHLMSPCT
jgi:hypothetical protein